MHFWFTLDSSDIDLLDIHLDLWDTDVLVNNLFPSKTSWKRLEVVFSVLIFPLPRRLEDVLRDTFKQETCSDVFARLRLENLTTGLQFSCNKLVYAYLKFYKQNNFESTQKLKTKHKNLANIKCHCNSKEQELPYFTTVTIPLF